VTTKIVNLNTARKQVARTKKRADASANALKFGRTKAQRESEVAVAARARAALDGHERES
jgi:hypothetical protein